MSKSLTLTAVVASAIAIAVTSGAAGQDERAVRPIEVTVYRDMAYNGPAASIDEAESDLNLAWPVNSIRVRGGRWEMCEQTRFRGRCQTVDRDTAMLGSILRGITIRSIRPVYDGAGGGGWGSGGGNWTPDPVANNQTLQGQFAQFHTQPQINGRRIRACATGVATANCTSRTADQFCRANGWNGSARAHMETIGREAYLADVLCVRSNY